MALPEAVLRGDALLAAGGDPPRHVAARVERGRECGGEGASTSPGGGREALGCPAAWDPPGAPLQGTVPALLRGESAPLRRDALVAGGGASSVDANAGCEISGAALLLPTLGSASEGREEEGRACCCCPKAGTFAFEPGRGGAGALPADEAGCLVGAAGGSEGGSSGSAESAAWELPGTLTALGWLVWEGFGASGPLSLPADPAGPEIPMESLAPEGRGSSCLGPDTADGCDGRAEPPALHCCAERAGCLS